MATLLGRIKPQQILLISTLALSSACDWTPTAQNSNAAPNSQLATLNHHQNIEIEDLSTADQIKLFNLKYQLNELTLSATREAIEKRHQPDDSITWLPPAPQTPKLNIAVEPSWMHTHQATTKAAPITIDIACTYSSRPCTDLMKQLEEWQALLNQSYTIRYYDLPQSYHRLGVESAAVVHCLSGEAKQNLQTFLWQRQGQLDMAALTGAIDIYSPNPSDTYQCMSSDATLNKVQGNIAKLKESGITLTPTVLVNGDYVSRGYEERELFSRLFSSLEFSVMESNPEVSWIQSWTTPDNLQNWALVEYQGQILRVTPGVNLGPYWIAGVEKNGLTLVKHDQIAALPMVIQSTVESPIDPETNTTSLYDFADTSTPQNETTAQEQQDSYTPQSHKERYEHVIGQLKAVPLPQDWLDEQLMRQGELEASLHLTESQIEGKSLVKLNKDEVDDFYTSLGMKPGDVIVRVNDEWIHEDNNTLFQSLANEEKVTISIMRKGLPVHFAFEAQ